MEAHFIILQNNGNPKKFSMRDGDEFTLGRSAEKCDITIEDESCSGQHCRIIFKNGRITIQDLGSKNGILLNKSKKISKINLAPNDKISIGNSVLYLNTKLMKDPIIQQVKQRKMRRTDDQLYIDTKRNETQLTGRRNKKSTQIHLEHNPRSKKLTLLLTNLSQMTDLIISLIIFILITKIIIVNDESLLEKRKESHYILFLISQEMMTYTGVSFAITFLAHKLNKKLSKGSIGQRIFKLRK